MILDGVVVISASPVQPTPKLPRLSGLPPCKGRNYRPGHVHNATGQLGVDDQADDTYASGTIEAISVKLEETAIQGKTHKAPVRKREMTATL